MIDGAHGGFLAVATNMAYPLVDMLLLGLIVSAVALADWRLERTWVLLGTAVIAFWIADSRYLITDAARTYQKSLWFNPLWNLSPVLGAWAAWLPHRPSVRRAAGKLGVRGILMPLLFACAALGTLVWSSFTPLRLVAVTLASLSLLVVIALFDLDGFKHYKDNFGHPAGDSLLCRLGQSLERCLAGRGHAYRMGGDEFCALIDAAEDPVAAVEDAAAALGEQGEGFSIGCSYGFVVLPAEAQDASEGVSK